MFMEKSTNKMANTEIQPIDFLTKLSDKQDIYVDVYFQQRYHQSILCTFQLILKLFVAVVINAHVDDGLVQCDEDGR